MEQRWEPYPYIGAMTRLRSFPMLLLFFTPLFISAQEGNEAFKKGYQAHQQGRYEKALRFYTRALRTNDSLKKAYHNRASVRIALDRYEKAEKDLDRTLELDPDYVPAYYNRANIHVKNGSYRKAHRDLNEVLQRQEEHQKALLLRGQVRQHLGKKEAGCQDFRKAERLGNAQASKYLKRFCRKDPLDLKSRWPEPKEWKVIRRNEDEQMKRVELIPKKEEFPEWEHFGSITALKGVQGIPMDTARYFLTRQAKGKCGNVRAHTIEKRDRASPPYIFFSLHCSTHINTQEPETQLWYVEQGERHLYAYFVAIRKKRMSPEVQEKWMAFLKQEATR